jgi:hypothetical protein
MNAISPLFLALFLGACTAPQKPEPEIKRAQPKPQEIHGRVGTPLPTQASGASAPSAMPSKKKEFAVASGEPKKQDSGQQAVSSSLNLVARCLKTS